MAFFLLWKNLRYHPHMPHFFLPSLFLFFLLPHPSRTNALTPTQNKKKKKTWASAYGRHTDQPEILRHRHVHSNQSSYSHVWSMRSRHRCCCCCCRRLQYPEPNQRRDQWFISVSACRQPGADSQTQKARQGQKAPPPHVEPCCSVELITHTLPPAHLAFYRIRIRINVELENIPRARQWHAINQRWAGCVNISVVVSSLLPNGDVAPLVTEGCNTGFFFSYFHFPIFFDSFHTFCLFLVFEFQH